MDDYQKTGPDAVDLAAVDLAPVAGTTERLLRQTREEACDVLRLLLVTATRDDPVSAEAGRLAREIAGCIPSEN
ncbi:DUF6417 family protein [Streptomyces sp. NPDC059785]|uniref:DUF6417 family protein n=1 Tax=unclassified Streptomyces TaxID=2593676 RepID=UPI00365F6B94